VPERDSLKEAVEVRRPAGGGPVDDGQDRKVSKGS
jgi:hypothetical protein